MLPVDLHPIIKPSALQSNPLVSVLITNYNYANFISEAIKSVLSQTYQNFEIIICDDGSTDNSIDIINNFIKYDKRIILVAKQNGGQASAINTAFAASKGDIISILDSDDLFAPNKLELVVHTFKNSNCGVVLHFLKTIDKKGSVIWYNTGEVRRGWIGREILMASHMGLQFGSSISLHREVAERCFPLPDIFRCDADRVLGNRALLLSELETIPLDLATFRIHDYNITSKSMMELSDKLETSLSRIKKIHEDTLAFFESNYKIKLDSSISDFLYNKRISTTILDYNLVNHKPLPYKYYRLVDSRRIKVIYGILFIIPRRASIRIFTWWRSASKSKEYARRIYRILIRLIQRA